LGCGNTCDSTPYSFSAAASGAEALPFALGDDGSGVTFSAYSLAGLGSPRRLHVTAKTSAPSLERGRTTVKSASAARASTCSSAISAAGTLAAALGDGAPPLRAAVAPPATRPCLSWSAVVAMAWLCTGNQWMLEQCGLRKRQQKKNSFKKIRQQQSAIKTTNTNE
jgi:hypothetical protein